MLNNLAEKYDYNKTYSSSDIVIYNNKLYICNDETTREFDETKWKQIYIADLMRGTEKT